MAQLSAVRERSWEEVHWHTHLVIIRVKLLGLLCVWSVMAWERARAWMAAIVRPLMEALISGPRWSHGLCETGNRILTSWPLTLVWWTSYTCGRVVGVTVSQIALICHKSPPHSTQGQLKTCRTRFKGTLKENKHNALQHASFLLLDQNERAMLHLTLNWL